MTDSQRTDNAAVLTGFYQALESGDVARAFEFVDENIVVTYPDSLPMAGEWRGHSGLLDLFAKVGELWQGRVSEVETLVSSDSHIVALLTTKGEVNGCVLTMPIAEVWRLHNGKLVEGKPFFWDTAVLERALTSA